MPRFRPIVARPSSAGLLLLAIATSSLAADPPGDRPAQAPLPPAGYVDACLELIRDGRYEEARTRLEPVVADHPGWARVHFYLGLAYHKDARYESARPLFERALLLEPEYGIPGYYLGWALYYLGEPDEARRRFEAFLAQRTDYADAIFALGLIDFDADALDAAEARFLRAAKLASAAGDRAVEAKSRARLADVRMREGDMAGARRELEASVKLVPANHEAWHKLSLVYERLGLRDEAAAARERHRRSLADARSEP